MDNITVIYDEKPCYDIYIKDEFNTLREVFHILDTAQRKICVITDSNVGPLYLEDVMNQISQCAKFVCSYTFKAGEESKNLDTITNIYEFLIQNKFDRKDVLVALGGGVVGDVTGFAAASYLRGICFIQVPTSLLAMVDSSIGGKTGVDFKDYKNMVGAFHMPSAVYLNLKVLNSLSKEIYNAGMGEIIKNALIRDAKLYDYIKKHHEAFEKRDLSIVEKMIVGSLNVKREIVEIDPKEENERALLNYGHTIGHAIERLKNFTWSHGFCVGIGSVAASYISYKRGYITFEEFKDIETVIANFGLPIHIDGLNPLEIVEATKADKKMEAGQIKFILLHKIGDAYVDATVSDEEMLEAVKYIME